MFESCGTLPRERLKVDILQEQSWFGGPLTSEDGRVWAGRRLSKCKRDECPCDGLFYGKYVPLCPFRLHAVPWTMVSGRERDLRSVRLEPESVRTLSKVCIFYRAYF